MSRGRRSEVLPSARRLINSLRDIGYDLPTAIADLVDNSIAANASVVDVDMRFEGKDSFIRISDDGRGMTWRVLEEAMRFGTRRVYGDAELGKFGLGLKSASLSQCRCLTVASKTSPNGQIHIAQWDLDQVEETDRWEVLRLTPREVSDIVLCPLKESAGTVVILEDLDRVFRFRSPGGSWAQESFDQACSEVEQHLAMVFHRFLSGEAARSLPLHIRINGQQVRAWDPFCRDEEQTLQMVPQGLTLDNGGQEERILVRPHVLPNEAMFSSPAAHARAAGPRRWNRQQGFYFYRGDRMIQSGGWSRLRTLDEHTKLARVAVDFPPSADSLFELNVSKTQVRLPAALRPEFAAITSSVARMAQQLYRVPGAVPEPIPTQFGASNADNPRVTAIHSLVEMVLGATEDALRDELSSQPQAYTRVIQRLRRMQAEFYSGLATLVGITYNGSEQDQEETTATGG